MPHLKKLALLAELAEEPPKKDFSCAAMRAQAEEKLNADLGA